jgi:dipeptidyl aminopeptidase/acylaminoacyl peptidase
VKKRFLAALVAAVAAAWLALQGSTAASRLQLTYSVDVPLPGVPLHDGGVCTVSPDGSRLRLTTRGLRAVAWSPDGRRLAYTRPLSREQGVGVFVANPDGSGERNLARGLSPANFSTDPAWSPDGRQVAFTTWNLHGLPQVFVAAADGSSRRALTLRVPGNPVQPAWAPNGRQLAVGVGLGPAASPRDLYLAEIDGSSSRLLATSAAEPTWAPDGSRIAFLGPGGSLSVVNADGSEIRTVAAGASGPAWSPDGRLIAFVRGDDLLVVRPDGRGERVVVPGPLPVRGPAWRRASDRAAATKRPCVIEGTARPDVLRGTRSADIIVAGPGADTIFAGGGDDVVLGGSGPDFVNGEAGLDRLVGGFGRDRIYGGRGDDLVFGRDAEADRIDGGSGNDAAYFDPGVVAATDRVRLVERALGRP